MHRIAQFIISCFIIWCAAAHSVGNAGTKPTKQLRALDLKGEFYTDDFAQLVERRTIRVLVPHSRTLFFNDRGTQRGLTADGLREFEQWVNKKYRKGPIPIVVHAIPVTRDQLIPGLINGRGDMAVGNITVTSERDKLVDFSIPLLRDTREILVTGKNEPALTSFEALSGRILHVRKSTTHYESALAMNERLKAAGKPAMTLMVIPDELETEDMMEMVNAGLLRNIIVDDWIARLWVSVLPKIKMHPDIVFRSGANAAWAVREGNPGLKAVLNDFITNQVKGSAAAERRVASYQKRFRQMANATDDAEWKKFEQTIEFFKKYSPKYGFDYLMMAAQGYQESRLNQSAKSPVGAIGIMQIMPATGKDLGVGDIKEAENNVHGGIKYMDILLGRIIDVSTLDDQNRALFAFAAYNAGPGRLNSLRREAEKSGLSPNIWFNNVEQVAAKRIGQETVQYVRNIYKYYAAYRLQLDMLNTRNELQKTITSTASPGQQ